MIVAAAVVLLLACVEVWARRARPHPEISRKLVHGGAALLCATFPWVFDSAVPVAVLAAGFTGALVVARRAGAVRALETNRRSVGIELFPGAVLASFLLAGDRPELHVAAMLVLGLADSAAALVGMRAGRTRYTVFGERRSVEGSSAFFLAAVPCLAVPLLATGTGDLGAAVLVAACCTALEAIAPRGTDNVVLPVAVCLLAPAIAALPASPVAIAVALLASAILLRHRLRNPAHGR